MTGRPRTLRGRLVLAAGGSIVAALALLVLLTVLLVGRQLHSTLDAALRQRAQAVAELAVSAPAVLSAPGGLESPVSGRQISVEVLDARGRILARSLTLGAALLPQDAVARTALTRGRAGFENVRVAGRPFRLYAAPVPDAYGPAAGGVVLVASETTDIGDTLRHLGVTLGIGGAVVAVLAVLTAAALTRRGLRPLRQLAGAAGEIERTADAAQRLPEGVGSDSGDEIGQLTGVLNRMLSSLERARTSERRFLADASHELRTPVTTLRGNIEYAARHGADAEVLADLQRDAVRLTRLVDDLLVLEREGAAAPELAPLELDALVREVLAEQPSERVALAGAVPVRVAGDPEALRRALANLLENGLRHGRGQVSVALRRSGQLAWLSVGDEGPGPDPDQRERLFERFWRGGGADTHPGSGLGLSIVAAIIERHHGRITVEGATFTIELPALED